MREYFTNNLGLKLIALLLAISIEVYFKSPRNLVSEVMKVPVEVRTTSPRKVLTGIDADTVAVKVRGPSPLIQQIQGTVRQFHIDVPPNPPDLLAYQLKVEDLGLPRGVEVIELEPAQLQLKFEQMVSKSLSVKPIIQGKPASGYVLAAVRASPIAVVARGPVSVLRKLAEIETQPIDIATYSESKEIVADLVTPSEREGEAESKLSLEPSVVNLALDIRPKKESRSFPRLPIAARQGEGEASGVALEPGVVTVVVASNDKKLAQLQEGEIRVFVDVSKAPTANSRLPVVVELPEGMMVEKVTPEAVRVVQK